MANVERAGTATGPNIEAGRHYSPDFRQQRTVIATYTTITTADFDPPTEAEDEDDDDEDHPTLAPALPHLPRPLHESASPWLLTAFSDFPGLDLTSPPFGHAPQHHHLHHFHHHSRLLADHSLPQLPALPVLPPLPPSFDSSPFAPHLFLHAPEPIFSSPPPPDRLAGLLAQPGPRLPSPTLADRPPPGLRLPPLMPPGQQPEEPTRLERLISSLTETSPSPRPRSSRRRRESSSTSPTTLHPRDRADSRPGNVKSEARGSRTPAPAAASDAAMPPTLRKRPAPASGSSSSRTAAPEASASRRNKRPRPSSRQSANAPPNPIILSDGFSDPFGDDADFDGIERQAVAGSQNGRDLKAEDEVADCIDLMDDDVPPPPPKPKSKNQVKLGNLQCSICMDDMTDLTATHCGHLFCGACLHGALHANANKTVCPICRQKIDVRTNGTQHPRSASKGFWPLQLKFMTATRKGKRKEGDSSR